MLNFNKIKSFLGKYKILKFSTLINAKEIHFKTKNFLKFKNILIATKETGVIKNLFPKKKSELKSFISTVLQFFMKQITLML